MKEIEKDLIIKKRDKKSKTNRGLCCKCIKCSRTVPTVSLLLLEIDDKVVAEGQTRSRRRKKHTPRVNKPRTAVEPQVTASSL